MPGCRDGIRKSPHYNHTRDAADPKWWMNRIPASTRILIINTGLLLDTVLLIR
jgi:hypothetical protein